MSGIDEQPKNIPKCPYCHKRPQYWTVHSGREPAIWFYSQEYLDSGELGEPYNQYKGEARYLRLEGDPVEFEKATCMGGCGKKITSYDEPELFTQIQKLFDSYFPHAIIRTDADI